MDSSIPARNTRSSHKKTNAKTKSKPQTSNGDTSTENGNDMFDLYLRNLPHLITEDDLRNYFSSFGDLKSVEIHNKGSKNHVYKYAFINFKDVTSAAAASRKRVHHICKRKIIARPADTLKKQIPKQKYCGNQIAKRPKKNDPKKSPILRLNDDCLFHLCSFLRLGDKSNLSATCIRFSEVVETMFHHKKSLTICKEEAAGLTLEQFKQILAKAGHHLLQIKVENCKRLRNPSKSLELISQMCPNLRELGMTRVEESYLLKEVGLRLHHLTRIELQKCQITDDICNNLTLLQNVEYLDLSYNKKITGMHLDKFPKLLYLNVRNCLNFQPTHFNSICEKGMLKRLNIIDCYRLPSDYYSSRALLKLIHLEELLITSIYEQVSYKHPYLQINDVSQLQSLKVLAIVKKYNQKCVGVDFFKQLAENKSDKLESLTLVSIPLDREKIEYIYKLKNLKKLHLSFNGPISDSLVARLSELTQLKYLNLSGCSLINSKAIIKLFDQPTEIKELDISGCEGITDEVVFEIAERLKARGTKSPCTIYVKAARISKQILKDKKYIEYAPFVKLSFEDGFEREMLDGIDYDSESDDEFGDSDSYDSYDRYGSDSFDEDFYGSDSYDDYFFFNAFARRCYFETSSYSDSDMDDSDYY